MIFFKNIKKLKGNNERLATVIDNQCTEKDIANNFKSIYNSLYNSIEDNDTNSTKLKIEELIKDRSNSIPCKQFCHNVSYNTIKDAIKCLNNDKSDETYNMFSDHFINASDLAYEKLSMLITPMIKHGTASEMINKSIIKPIPKNKNNSLSDLKNYRSISHRRIKCVYAILRCHKSI